MQQIDEGTGQWPIACDAKRLQQVLRDLTAQGER